MKKALSAFFALGLCLSAHAQPTNPAVNVYVYVTVNSTNGEIHYPTNFFKANSNLLNQAVAASGGGSIAISNIIYVAKNGRTNGTGILSDPILTLNAAQAAWSSNKTIIVAPGLYGECLTNCQPSGINWFFEPGADIDYSGTTTNIYGDQTIMFATNGIVSILGEARFKISTTNTGVFSIDVFRNLGATIILHGGECVATNSGNGTPLRHTSGVTLAEFRGAVIGVYSGPRWTDGYMGLRCDVTGTLTASGGGVWSEPGAGNFWVEARIVNYVSLGATASDSSRNWIYAQEITGKTVISGGRNYFPILAKANPVGLYDGTVEAYPFEIGGGRNWITSSPKITTGGAGAIHVDINSDDATNVLVLKFSDIENANNPSDSIIKITGSSGSSNYFEKFFIGGDTAQGGSNLQHGIYCANLAPTIAINQLDVSESTNASGVYVEGDATSTITLKDVSIQTATNQMALISAPDIEPNGDYPDIDPIHENVTNVTARYFNIVGTLTSSSSFGDGANPKYGRCVITNGIDSPVSNVFAPYGSLFYQYGTTNVWVKQNTQGTGGWTME